MKEKLAEQNRDKIVSDSGDENICKNVNKEDTKTVDPL